jgi:hypothetical protein
MIEKAIENEACGDILLADMGQGFGFRTGMFDGVVRCVLGASLWPHRSHPAAVLCHARSRMRARLCVRCRLASPLGVPHAPARMQHEET